MKEKGDERVYKKVSERRFKDALNGCVGVLPTLLTVSLPPP